MLPARRIVVNVSRMNGLDRPHLSGYGPAAFSLELEKKDSLRFSPLPDDGRGTRGSERRPRRRRRIEKEARGGKGKGSKLDQASRGYRRGRRRATVLRRSHPGGRVRQHA